GDHNIIGGLAGNFFRDIKKIYDNPNYWLFSDKNDYKRLKAYGDKMLFFEPKIAQLVLQKDITDNKIPIIHNERLDLYRGVKKSRTGEISAIVMESGKIFKGKVFIDATYEGDLMAKAGVDYIVGRESSGKYNESLNGINRETISVAEFHRGVHDGKNLLIKD